MTPSSMQNNPPSAKPMPHRQARVRSPDYSNLVREYVARANAHDIEAIMAMFATGAQMTFSGLGTFATSEAIRSLHAYDRGIETRLQLLDTSDRDLNWTAQIREENAWLTVAGLVSVTFPAVIFTFTEQGFIEQISATMADTDRLAMEQVLADFLPRLLSYHPQAAEALFDINGRFIYGEANGRVVVALLRQWRLGER